MYIRKTKVPNKNDYLIYLVEGYRDRDNKVKQRILKSYGYLSELIKEDDNILEKLKTEAAERTLQQTQDTEEILFLNLNEKRDGTQNVINYGYVFLESIYNKLGIPSFIADYQSNQSYRYDLNDILKLLVFSRALNPESKKKTYERKSNYFFELKDFSMDDLYRSLDHLTALKDDLMIHLNKEIMNQGLRDVSLVFYDVTNYYFESMNFDGFKERGVSKEHKDTGIVQMGLFIDNNGIPITYELFPGNTNDLSTMKPILEKVKKDFNLGEITIVADKGNNSKSNLSLIDGFGYDYIISQRIRNRGNTYADIVLDESGYTYNKEANFKYKLVSFDKEVTDSDGLVTVIKEHLMCFWSKDEELYQKSKRGQLEEKIEKYISTPALLNASNSFGIKKYFKKIKVDRKTGEILSGKDTYVFNQEKYERDIALDGYYTIVTNNLELDPLTIIQHYRKLSKIEESFKITKSDLEGRPIYVWTKPHIEGHFLTCYLALVLYRLLQIKLDNKYPVHRLKESLNQMNAVMFERGLYLLTETDDIYSELERAYGFNMNYKKIKVEYLKNILNKVKTS